KGTGVIVALVPVAVIVTIGTYLLFTQLSVFVIRRLKKKESIFWKKTNMILFSDLSHRMKDNARVFFMVAIISTVAFSAIGTLVSLNTVLTKGMIDANPTSFSYAGFDDETKEDALADAEEIEAIIQEHDLQVDRAEAELFYFPQDGKEQPLLIVKASDFNAYAQLTNQEKVEIADGEAVVPPASDRMLGGFESERSKEIQLADGSTIPVTEAENQAINPDVLPVMSYYLVSDH